MSRRPNRPQAMKLIKAAPAGFALAGAIAAATAAASAIPEAHAVFKTGRVCNAQGVCCTTTAQGQIADCVIAGSPGSPGNPGQYSDPYPNNVVTMPPSTGIPFDPAHSDAGPCVLFPNSPGCR